jgi:ABC-type molybdenum transport system ATPase subunit/photorepair protein PhrA
MTDFVIDVHDLKKNFGTRRVAEGLTLQVGSGEICGFLGANGSGKTTAIRMLCGLLVPDGGSGTCLGRDIIREASLIRRATAWGSPPAAINWLDSSPAVGNSGSHSPLASCTGRSCCYWTNRRPVLMPRRAARSGI